MCVAAQPFEAAEEQTCHVQTQRYRISVHIRWGSLPPFLQPIIILSNLALSCRVQCGHSWCEFCGMITQQLQYPIIQRWQHRNSCFVQMYCVD